MIYKQRTDEEKQRTRNLIDLGGLVNKAGMGDYPRPFLLGLFLKCKREIVPKLTRQELDELSEIGFLELQKRVKNRPKARPKEQPSQAGQPEPLKTKQKRELYFYEKEELEPWMLL